MAKDSSSRLQEELTNFTAFEQSQINALKSISESLSNTMMSTAQVRDTIASLNNAMQSMVKERENREHEERERARKRELEEESTKVSDTLAQLGHRLVAFSKVVADTANRYSQISNTLIQVSGASSHDVRATRSEIVHDIISQLNRETGNFFNPESSYQKVVDIANQANIGNLEAIEAITRPMLIASEAMNVNQGNLASLMSKWYTRYNFSSAQMESMVDEIRGNTAGNNATAEATLENINKFQNFIGVYADSTEEMQNMVDSIAEESSRLESVGINSGYIFDYMKQIGQGDMSNSRAIMSLLANSGTGIDWLDAQNLLRSGNSNDMKLVSEALAKGAIALGESVKYSTVTAEALKAWDLDVEELYNILSASNALYSPEDFAASVSGVSSSIDSIGGKFNTWQDKIANILSSFSEGVAYWQEKFHVGLSDILVVATSMFTLMKVNSLFNGSGGGRATTGLLGSLEMGGFNVSGGALTGGAAAGLGALTSAGVLAGVGGAIYGGVKGYNDLREGNTGIGLSNLAGGLAMGAGGISLASSLLGIGAANAWNPAGWALLISGGAILLGTAMTENATALSGNADKVATEISSIGESLQKENKERVQKLSDLQYQFYKETDVSKQRVLLEESGLFKKSELDAIADENLSKLIDSYKSAAEAMDTTTDGILKTAEKYYTEKYDTDQKDFISSLQGISGNDQRVKALELARYGISDEATLNSISKILSDGTVSDREWKKITEGGIFSKSNLSDQAISLDAMNAISNALGLGKSYESDSKNEVISLYQSLWTARSKADVDKLLKGVDEKVLDELYSVYGPNAIENIKDSKSYAVGSNYITSNQRAYLHEGEAVIPAKYNPAANVTELEMLRIHYKESMKKDKEESMVAMHEITSVLSEIKDFLSYWRDDNIKRESSNRRNSRLEYNSAYIAKYMASH